MKDSPKIGKYKHDEQQENYLFELKDRRKFDYETIKCLNKEQFVKKIRV